MSPKIMIALFIAALSTPALALPYGESAQSYYARQMKSCAYKLPRESVWDLLKATRPVYIDECCARSVEAMQKAGAQRIAKDSECPSGTRKQSLECAASKTWCE